MSERKPSDEAERIVVRLPDGLRDRLTVTARASGRSVSAEVVARLQRSFDLTSAEAADPVARAAALADALERIARATETIARHQPDMDSFPT